MKLSAEVLAMTPREFLRSLTAWVPGGDYGVSAERLQDMIRAYLAHTAPDDDG